MTPLHGWGEAGISVSYSSHQDLTGTLHSRMSTEIISIALLLLLMQFQAWFSFISPATFSFGAAVPQAAGTAPNSPHPLIQDRPTDKFLSPVSSLFYHNILMLRISPNKNSRALLCPQKKHAL